MNNANEPSYPSRDRSHDPIGDWCSVQGLSTMPATGSTTTNAAVVKNWPLETIPLEELALHSAVEQLSPDRATAVTLFRGCTNVRGLLGNHILANLAIILLQRCYAALRCSTGGLIDFPTVTVVTCGHSCHRTFDSAADQPTAAAVGILSAGAATLAMKKNSPAE